MSRIALTAFAACCLLALDCATVLAAPAQVVPPPAPSPMSSPLDVWAALLKPHDFGDTPIIEDHTVIELSAPYRSEDAAVTPVRIKAMIPQTPARYIQTIHLYVDENPEPKAGTFTFTPQSGRADLALRIRVDRYTHVRAIAILNNGEHHMASSYVKAQGGCAIPMAIDYSKAMAGLGHIQLRAAGDASDAGGIAAQVRVRHPNFTGMQMDYKIYAVRPAHYVKTIRVLLNGAPIMTAETGISISEDPSFRFFLAPTARGHLEAEVADTKGNHWREAIEL